jgi:hypothetical protein
MTRHCSNTGIHERKAPYPPNSAETTLVIHILLQPNQPLAEPMLLHILQLLQMLLPLRTPHAAREPIRGQRFQAQIGVGLGLRRHRPRNAHTSTTLERHVLWQSRGGAGKPQRADRVGAVEVLVQSAVAAWVGADGLGRRDPAVCVWEGPAAAAGEVLARARVDGAWETATLEVGEGVAW